MRHKPSLSGDPLMRLSVYGFDVIAETEEHDVVLMTTRYTSPSSAEVYEISTPTEDRLKIMDLIDIVVRADYRNKGIGTQMLKIFEKIARENGCKYICGQLGYDRRGTPVELQKKFFEKNGYELWFDERAQFSGWVAKKSIT